MANNPSSGKNHGGDKAAFEKELAVPPIRESYKGSSKLTGKVAIITGGDSGIGRSVAVHFAREGASVTIAYNEADKDALETQKLVEKEGAECVLFKADLRDEDSCRQLIQKTIKTFGKVDILVNNAGDHEEDKSIQGISSEQLERVFAINIYSFFYCTKAATDVMKEGGIIINTASVVAYRGSEHLLDYSATKGAIVAFTRSLAKNLAPQKNPRQRYCPRACLDAFSSQFI